MDSTLQSNSKQHKGVEKRDNDTKKNHSSNSSIQEQLQDFNNLGPDYFNNNNPELQDLEDQTSENEANGSDKDKRMVDGQREIDDDDDDEMQEEECSATPIEASHPPMQLMLVPHTNNQGAVAEAGSVSEIMHPSMVTTYTMQNNQSNIICCINDRVSRN